MTTTRKGTKKTARTSSSDSISSTIGGVEVGNDSKRPRTDSASASASASTKEEDTYTDTLPVCMGVCEGYNLNSCCIRKLCALRNNYPSQAVSRDNVNSASESNNAVTANNNNNNNDDDDEDDEEESQNKELPTPVELSQELCKIVSDRYSRDESLQALKNLTNWAKTGDNDFLKSFHMYGGIVRVVDFLKATMNDLNCKGFIRTECIGEAADVISMAAFDRGNAMNKDIATKIITTLMVCGGIDTLITASEDYTGDLDFSQLNALCAVWRALRHTVSILKDASLMNQKTASTIFETGIDVMSQLKSNGGGDFNSEILEHIFCTFSDIVIENYITDKYFQDKNILSKCLEVLKRNGVWISESREGLIQEAIVFFDSCCDVNLLDNSSDYEMILPLLVIALKKIPLNRPIRELAMNMMDLSCSTINDKKMIERSGALEILVALLASDHTNGEAEKYIARILIGKIVA